MLTIAEAQPRTELFLVFIRLAALVPATRAVIVTRSAARRDANDAHRSLTFSDEGDL